MAGKRIPFHLVFGLTISHRKPMVVNGSSACSEGMATSCSVKLRNRIRVSAGTTNPYQGDSRGNKRRKSTAPPTTCRETRLQSRQKRMISTRLVLNAATSAWKEESVGHSFPEPSFYKERFVCHALAAWTKFSSVRVEIWLFEIGSVPTKLSGNFLSKFCMSSASPTLRLPPSET